jgi:hypothetical protein
MHQPAAERDEALRRAFKTFVANNYRPDQLVFVDEAGTNRWTTTREYGWAPIGSRARRHDVFVRGTRCVVYLAYNKLCLNC